MRDMTMGNLYCSRKEVNEMLAAGRKVLIIFTYSPPEKAAGVAFGRALEPKDGRTVPVEALARDHFGAPRTVLALADEFASDPRVKILVLDNSGSLDDIRFRDIDFLREKVNSGEGSLEETLRSVRKGVEDKYFELIQNGQQIPDYVYEAFMGEKPPRGH